VELWETTNSIISGNNITNNGDGIALFYSSNNSIVGNDITANNGYGILIDHFSKYNSIVGNNVTNNWYGIALYATSNYNSIVGNNVTNNWYGIGFHSSSNYNSMVENDITANNGYGIALFYSSNNSIVRNDITNNREGILLCSSSNNSIFHNNFIDNAEQVYDYSWDYPWRPPSINVWDNGYPSGGNYWSDYTGVDEKSGPNQDQPGSDGIGDTPYVIDENNIDRYPLMQPWGVGKPPERYMRIFIRSDGSVEPVDAPLIRVGNSYIFTEEIFGEIIVEKANIVINGNGFTLTSKKDRVAIKLKAGFVNVTNLKIKNFFIGIHIGEAVSMCRVSNCIIEGTDGSWGIYLDSSSSLNNILKNRIVGNDFGLYLNGSSLNTIQSNVISESNTFGIRIEGGCSNKIIENNVSNNYIGVHVYKTCSNKFYHNNFVDNHIQVWVTEAANTWNLTYSLGGNYWSDYSGNDYLSGPKQDEPSSDGIGDSPYKIDEYNIDHYPLMKPWKSTMKYACLARARSEIYKNYYNWLCYICRTNKDLTLELFTDTVVYLTAILKSLINLGFSDNIICQIDYSIRIINDFQEWLKSIDEAIIELYDQIRMKGCFGGELMRYLQLQKQNCTLESYYWTYGSFSEVLQTLKYEISNINEIGYYAHLWKGEDLLRNDAEKRMVDETYYRIIDFCKNDTETIGFLTSIIEKKSTLVIDAYCDIDLHLFDQDGKHTGAIYSSDGTIIGVEYGIDDVFYTGPYGPAEALIILIGNQTRNFTLKIVNRCENTSQVNVKMKLYDENGTSIQDWNQTVMLEPYDHANFLISATKNQTEITTLLEAIVDLRPDTLNLISQGKWITAYIELPEGYNVGDINVSSILLNDTIPVDLSAPIAIGDFNNDTVPDLMVCFNWTDVTNYILSKDIVFGNVTLEVSGKLYNDMVFTGTDTILVSSLIGDVNVDGKVDVKDIQMAAMAFGSYPGHPRWNPNVNFIKDNKIDLKDIYLIARNFGKQA